MENRIVTLEEYHMLDDKTVAVSGCFDVLHIGHIRFFEAAKEHGEKLIVLLESDRFIIENKKRDVFHPQKERAEILSHIDLVDIVVVLPFMNTYETYHDMWQKIRPNIIALTEGDPYIDEKRKQAKSINAHVEVVTPLIVGKSTTQALKQHPDKNDLS